MPANIRPLVVLFWRRVVPEGMAAAVRVDRSARGQTRVRIEAPVAWPPFRRRGHGFRITTTPLALGTDHFPEAAARRGVAHNKEKKRGRVLYCQQLRDPQARRPGLARRGQVVAALSGMSTSWPEPRS